MKKRICLIAGVVTMALPAVAATPQTVIDARKANFKVIGKANKAIADELKAGSPNIAVVRANARTISQLSDKVATWFPRGTGKSAAVKTEAGPLIWQQPADFAAAAVKFRSASGRLMQAAQGNDLGAIKAAQAAVGATCKGCHDTYRVKD